MKKKQYYIIIGALCLSTLFAAHAQNGRIADRVQEPLSPSERRFHSILLDGEMSWEQRLESNPAFYELRHAHETFRMGRYRSVLLAGYAGGDQEGDFLPYEGNSSEDFRLVGSGEYSIRSAGTIWGKARYARGKQGGIGWCATRYPELYRPYFSTDSVGGDFHYEDYEITGGYSFRLSDYFLGVYGSFHGEQAHRKSDPRALNNTTWLGLGIGAGRLLNGHLLMMKAGFTRNKQHMSLRYWRPGEQQRFFVGYGFGLYDMRESHVAFGYSRMYYMNEGTANISYQSPVGHPVSLRAGLDYTYNYMKTEESSIKDLYAARTHYLYPYVRAAWHSEAPWHIALLLQGKMDRRNGYENIFEQYLVDAGNNIYDFRQIDRQQNYVSTQMENLVQASIGFDITPAQKVELTGGIVWFKREEKYKADNYKIMNESFSPHGGIRYQWQRKKSEWDISCLLIRHMPTGQNSYSVKRKNPEIQILDFQHAFAPYAYYNSRFTSLQAEVTYVYHLPGFGVGITLKGMYKQGKRDAAAVFSEPVGFASSAPMVSTMPDKHNEKWGNAALFILF